MLEISNLSKTYPNGVKALIYVCSRTMSARTDCLQMRRSPYTDIDTRILASDLNEQKDFEKN